MKSLCSVILALCVSGPALAANPTCTFDPSESLKRTVIGIEREFTPDDVYFDKNSWSEVHGIRGTAWLFNASTLVTIGHVATASKFSNAWKDVTLHWSDNRDEKWTHKLVTRVRLKDILIGVAALEPIMTLELEHPVPGMKIAKVSGSPLMRNQPVVGIGYKDQELRFTTGHLAIPEPSGEPDDSSAQPPPPYLPFEMVDADKKDGIGDRYAIDYGSSGAPIFNCNGEVVAVVNGLMTKELSLVGQTVRMTTPWGQANVTGVSALPLLDRKK